MEPQAASMSNPDGTKPWDNIPSPHNSHCVRTVSEDTVTPSHCILGLSDPLAMRACVNKHRGTVAHQLPSQEALLLGMMLIQLLQNGCFDYGLFSIAFAYHMLLLETTSKFASTKSLTRHKWKARLCICHT